MTEPHSPQTTKRHALLCQEILRQLGGNAFKVITGSRDFVSMTPTKEFEARLHFKLGSGARTSEGKRPTHFAISLTYTDTYTLASYYISKGGTKVTELETREGIYCDQLRETFREMTGLYTSLEG